VWLGRKLALDALARETHDVFADVDVPKNRSWRTFQLAFLLLNLEGLTRLEHPDRSADNDDAVADLLWFPTGGGKTEAYLRLISQSLESGRGALGRPWVFDECFDALSPESQRASKARVIARHVGLIRAQFNEKYALVQMKKHLAWYTEGLGHATECRARIFQTRSPEEVWDLFQSYWERPRPETSQTASTLSPRMA